eukprot:2721213-Pleurochrysis_carterae.AAC.1
MHAWAGVFYLSDSLRDRYQRYLHPGGREPTMIQKYDRRGAASRRRRGGWGAPVRWLKEGRSLGGGGHREREYPRSWGAERERSAITHAMREQIGKPCM